MNALALTECVRPNPGDMSTLAPTSEKYYSPPLMIHHPQLYEVPEHPVPAVLAQSRREAIFIHDDTGAGTPSLENNFMTVPKSYEPHTHTSSSLTAAKKRGREDGPDETPFKRKRGSGN